MYMLKEKQWQLPRTSCATQNDSWFKPMVAQHALLGCETSMMCKRHARLKQTSLKCFFLFSTLLLALDICNQNRLMRVKLIKVMTMDKVSAEMGCTLFVE